MPSTLHPPAPARRSSSRVIKIPAFKGKGTLSPRALYIYLPPGYRTDVPRSYPVLYMHDGQNCFEAFAGDSFSGSWRADETADALIEAGRMQPCLIVAISNGGERRLAEYLPPYSTFNHHPPRPKHPHSKAKRPLRVRGVAEKTARYYQHEVAPFIAANYRVLTGRKHTATCGSSMGGLFSTYLAWEHPEFAKHHAIMSPSYWMTRSQEGQFETIERIKRAPKRDLRIWLDSGEGTEKRPGGDDDNKFVTLKARRALLEASYREGEDFVYYLDRGATHHESAWAKRLPKVFEFLFPVEV